MAFCAVMLVWLGVSPALAHPMSFGSAVLRMSDQQFTVELVLDVPDDVLSQSLETRRAELLTQVEEGLTLRFGEVRPALSVAVLDLGSGEQAVDVVRVRGERPTGAQPLRIGTSKQLGDLAVELRSGESEPLRVLVRAGQTSEPLSLLGSARRDEPTASSAASGTTDFVSTAPGAPKARAQGADVRSFGSYLGLGFWHIVPEGLDHILFVISLLLLASTWWELLGLLSLFTLGHAVSLAASLFGSFSASASWVEPWIAASLAYAGLESLVPSLRPFRYTTVIVFGLLHGSGFAGALAKVRIPEDQRWTSLVGFNLGVELGQLAVAILPWLLIQWMANTGHLHARERRGALLGIGAVGLSWAILRVLG